MGRAGNQFLARTGFSVDQNGCIRLCNAMNLPKKFSHPGVLAEQALSAPEGKRNRLGQAVFGESRAGHAGWAKGA